MGLAAQEGWVGSLKFGGGPTTGAAKTLMGNAGYSFAPTLEFAYHYSKTDAFVLGAGLRFFPGDISTASYIPAAPSPTTSGYITTGTTNAARTANLAYIAGGPYEARLRKPDTKGLELTGMYRHDYNPDLYVQAGLRLGLYKVNVRDTGTQITYTESAIAGTGVNLGRTNYGVTPSSIVTIMDDLDKKTTSLGVIAGLGYQLTEYFSIEANVFTVRLGDPRGVTTTSVASEVCFGIRF
jgi:opacity protein-like surface antigen